MSPASARSTRRERTLQIGNTRGNLVAQLGVIRSGFPTRHPFPWPHRSAMGGRSQLSCPPTRGNGHRKFRSFDDGATLVPLESSCIDALTARIIDTVGRPKDPGGPRDGPGATSWQACKMAGSTFPRCGPL